MKKKLMHFNIHDLNFILTFSGFAFFTSLTTDISSVSYRAFALLVALLSLSSRMFRRDNIPVLLSFLLFFIVVLDIKIAYHLVFDSSVVFVSARNLALLFVFCITLIPVLAYSVSNEHIHWKTVLYILEILLLITITKSYFSTMNVTEAIRMSLNNRQNTLAFGDNSGYLVLLSLSLLRFSSVGRNLFLRNLWRLVLVFGVAMGFLGIIRAGSRGPLVSTMMGILCFLVSLRISRQVGVLLLSLFFISFFDITTNTIEKIAPVLFSRMSNTIEEGDMSGRDILFKEAVQKMRENPVKGNNPIILSNNDSFTTCHNGYLLVGVCLGVLGFIVNIGFTLWLVFCILRYRSKLNTPEALFIVMMFFYTSTRAMTGADLASTPNYTLTVAAACVIISRIKEISDKSE